MQHNSKDIIKLKVIMEMNFLELKTKSSYELAQELEDATTKYIHTCDEQDNATNQADFERTAVILKECKEDILLLSRVIQQVIANENNTEEAKKKENLYAKYANKYFKYGNDEVVYFCIGDKRDMMSFSSVYCCDRSKLQITSCCNFKKEEKTRIRVEI